MQRRPPWWLLLVLAAVLGGVAAIALDRALLTVRAPPSPAEGAAAQPTAPALPPTSTPLPPPAAPGDASAQIALLRGALAQQGGLLLVARAERHTALAADALESNDYAAADRELLAARAALDSAFGLVAEDLKQVIDRQRREVGRIRSELQIHPEGMDTRLRAAQDLLLGLIVPPTQ